MSNDSFMYNMLCAERNLFELQHQMMFDRTVVDMAVKGIPEDVAIEVLLKMQQEHEEVDAMFVERIEALHKKIYGE